MKTSILVLLALMAFGGALPAGAQAGGLAGSAHSHGLIGLDAAEPEAGEEAAQESEEAEEAETAEGGEEAEEAEAAEEEAEDEEEQEGVGGEHKRAERGRSHRHGEDEHAGRRSGSTGLSLLALTSAGKGALKHHGVSLSAVGFRFSLSAKTTVEVTLSTGGTVHARGRTIARFGLVGKRGTNTERLRGHGALPSGLDRLTVTPSHGTPRTIFFRAR